MLAAEARAAPVPARLEGLMSLGGGTALKLSSPAMLELREQVAERFFGLLPLQDQQEPRLHIIIQNKVSPHEAKALRQALGPSIESRDFSFSGLALHRYRGGPWAFAKRWSFRG